MARYRLSELAKEDLIQIARWGDVHYGIPCSNQYRDTLKQHFEFLAENPLLYPSISYIRKGYRMSVCGVHAVYYRVVEGGVEIMAILRSQDRHTHLP